MDLSRFSGRIAYEHLHRYAICRESLAGKRVLDLACGTGYGTALLAEAGAKVTGLDISSEAIKIAKARYQRPGVKFLIGDCYDLPFEDGSFDVVVANEMIEHVDQHDALLAEVKRVLTDDGLFLVSTPNKPVYNRFKPPNVYHIAEMEIPEFHRLLSRYFDHIKLTGTRMALVSVGFELEPSAQKSNLAAARIYHGSVDSAAMPSIENGELALRDPEYVLAACSNKQFDAAGSPSTLFYSRDDDLWLEHEKIMAWASQLHDEDEALRTTVAQTRTDADNLRDALMQSEAEKSNLAVRVDDLRAAAQSIAELSSSQREAVERATNQHTEITVRLLEEVVGTAVSPEPAAIAATIMQLGQKIALAGQQAAELERLAKALDESQRQLAVLRDVFDAESRSKLQIQFELKEATSAHQRLVREVEEARTRIELTEAALAEARASIVAAEAAREVQGQEISRLQIGLDDALAERAAAAEAQQFRDQEIERLQAELAEEHSRAADNEQLRRGLADEAEQLRSLVERLRGQISAETDAAKAAREEVAQLRNLLSTREPSALLPAANAADPSKPTDRNDPAKEKQRAAMAQAQSRITSSLQIARQIVADQMAKDSPEAPQLGRTNLAALKRIRPPFKTAIFNSAWVRAQSLGSGRVTLGAYLTKRSLHHLDPHPLFSVDHYLRGCAGHELGQTSPLEHYVLEGWRHGLDPHPYFANDWYLAQNRDVLAHNRINPLDHYLIHGWKEGRWPNPAFDPRAYLDRYPDVMLSGMEPLTHFVAHGQAEGRETQARGIVGEWSDLLVADAPGTPMLSHLLSGSPGEGHEASATFSTESDEAGEAWPPKPIDDYWPPQGLRDFVLDGYGDEALPLYWYLYSVMASFSERQAEFADSSACRSLLARAQQQARERLIAEGEAPEASIIIPVYNNVLDTLLCIISILDTDQCHSFEIIVADDGSNDATAQLITSIGGVVRYIRQPRNYGFLRNCNEAAKHVSGRTIVLLNNDTLVMPRWLDKLLAPFDDLPGIGLVGSKLINWDGTLQEAGGIFWRDGSAWNFGRNQNPRAPEFSYLKDVDYCSGAAIAVPSSLWQSVGGFDPAFSPAYCEDSDLAFRIRDAGLRVVLAPEAEVVHHEGRSHGRDLSAGGKAYQIVNQKRLFERWKSVLDRDHFPNGENVLRARDRSFNKRHVLIIDHYVPQFDRDAGSRTIFGFIRYFLQEGWSVTFWPDNLWRDPTYSPLLQSMGVEVIFGAEFANNFEKFLEDRRDLYDLAMVSRPHVSVKYIDTFKKYSDAPLLYYGHDVHFNRMLSERALEGGGPSDEAITAMRDTEIDMCARCDLAFFPSEEEASLMQSLTPKGSRVRAIPAYFYDENELNLREAAINRREKSTSDPHLVLNMLFVGGFAHSPNQDAVLWFCDSIIPQLVNLRLPFKLRVAGSNPPPEIVAISHPDVEILGYVSDQQLEQLYHEADIVIAPLRYGAGVKGKVVEALANGVPVVTTDVGAQGIDPEGKVLFIGNDAASFAQQIKAAADPKVGSVRSKAGIDLVRTKYTLAALREALRETVSGR